MCSLDGFSKKRQQIFPKAKGKILEVGIGSGLNLEHYNHSNVESVVGIDPAEPSIKIAKQKINMLSLPFPVEFIIGSAESMSFNDSTFDSIVVGYSLCTIPDVEKEPYLRLAECLKMMEGFILLSMDFLPKKVFKNGNIE